MSELSNETSASEPAMTDHAYDGIQEYDNPTPGWWTWIFILTVVWSAVYFLVVTLAGGELSPVGNYERAKLAEMKAGGVLASDAPTLVRLSHDEQSIKIGESIYSANCISCHGRGGIGLTGPNLTDERYVNVEKITDIVDVLKQGRNNGAMPAWGNRLSPSDIVRVSAFVASLRGQNRPGKAPEPNSKSIPPWEG